MRRMHVAALCAALAGICFLPGCSPDPDSEASASKTVSDQLGPFNDDDALLAARLVISLELTLEVAQTVMATSHLEPGIGELAYRTGQSAQEELERALSWSAVWGQTDLADHPGAATPVHVGEDEHLARLRDEPGPFVSGWFLEEMMRRHETLMVIARDHQDGGINPIALEYSERLLAESMAEIEQLRRLRSQL